MALKAELANKSLADQHQHFKDIGAYTSDKFYVNEDAMKRRMNSIKGNAKIMSQTMHENYQQLQELNKDRMKKEAEERIKLNQDLAQEDLQRKQKKAEKKLQLKEIQDRDQRRSLERKDISQQPDFGPKNILSYVYEKKEHKAYENRKRNDYMISLMKDQFRTQGNQTQKLEDSVIMEETKIKTRYDEEMTRKQ